jgi:hypothetical protein
MLWRFENVLAAGATTPQGAQRKFVPREGRVTGRTDIHDIGMAEIDGVRAPVFVNTLFSCLATVSDRASFRPLWRPKFVSALAPEHRCHLNGLAMDGARPAYVSAVSRSDVADGWRERRQDGGVVIDVASGEIVASGLSMPHSPRLYDGKLWLLNSGTGEFGTVDRESGAFTPVAFCPGYARGLAFAGRHAVIGLSRPRPHLRGTCARRAALRQGRGRPLRAADRRHRYRQRRRVAPLRAHDRGALRRGGHVRRAAGGGGRLPRRRHPARDHPGLTRASCSACPGKVGTGFRCQYLGQKLADVLSC